MDNINRVDFFYRTSVGDVVEGIDGLLPNDNISWAHGRAVSGQAPGVFGKEGMVYWESVSLCSDLPLFLL